jgi:magnesium transporter
MARKLVVKRSKKAGAGPGAMVHIGRPSDRQSAIRVISYGRDGLQDQVVDDAARCADTLGADRVTWMNADGVHQAALIETIGNRFGLHPLVMEDILNTDQRPKVEDYEGYLFIVLRMLRYDAGQQQVSSEQLSLVLGDRFVLTLQERPGDVFDTVRERLRAGRKLRQMPSDALAYALIDAVVDHYFVVLEQLGDQLEILEDELVARPTPTTLSRIHHFKREILMLRKAVWPLREVLGHLWRDEGPLISAETRLFLRDVYDHSVHIMDTVETFRELLAGMLDLYVSSIGNRMNEVMKMLTLIATVFMPLTFIAGVYGMNFAVMPELQWTWGYPAVLLLMLAIAVGLLLFFRRRHWL